MCHLEWYKSLDIFINKLCRLMRTSPGCRAENFALREAFSKYLTLIKRVQKNTNSLFKHWSRENCLILSANAAKMLITCSTIVAYAYRLEHMLCISGITIAVNVSYLTLKIRLVRTFEIRLFLNSENFRRGSINMT